MAENTNIEWADHTFNPWTGCTKVGPGCDHCYAESWAKRSGNVQWGAGQKRRRTTAANWAMPLRWNERARAEGRRYRVFCASLADVFDNEVPPEWRQDLFALIRDTPHLDWLLLTKRVGNAQPMIRRVFDDAVRSGATDEEWPFWPWPNVWLGATVVNREEMLRDGPKLMAINARVRFWSVEPMLGDLGEIPRDLMPDWVIAGGESGHDARPAHPDWFCSLRNQCGAAGVPFLFKQWGEWAPTEDWSRPDSATDRWLNEEGTREALGAHRSVIRIHRAGKKAAGRLLDGREHTEYPEVSDAAH